MTLRWGIASTGLIANDFVTALKGLDPAEHRVVAVAARTLDRAKAFAATHDIPKFLEGYEQLALDPDVQVVYVSVLNPYHHHVTMLMLEHGKPVLCEKPFTLNERLTREVIQMARCKNLFIMEAIWTRFLPVYVEVEKLIRGGAIGDIKYATVTFGLKLEEVDRVMQKELGGSTILDIGLYTLQFQQFVFRGLKPEKVVAAGHVNDQGVDKVASAIIIYPESKIAVVTCNATGEMPNEAVIVGSKGTIKIPQFWTPVRYSVNDVVTELPFIENRGTFNYHNSAGLAYEAQEVRKCLMEGKIESSVVPHEETIELAGLLDSWRQQLGVFFDVDQETGATRPPGCRPTT